MEKGYICYGVGGMTCLDHWNEFPMVNVLVCIVTH